MFDQKFSVSKFVQHTVYVETVNENLCSFLFRDPKKFRHNNSSCLFQEFLDEIEQACRGVHDREFEPTEASEISRPSIGQVENADFSDIADITDFFLQLL